MASGCRNDLRDQLVLNVEMPGLHVKAAQFVELQRHLQRPAVFTPVQLHFCFIEDADQGAQFPWSFFEQSSASDKFVIRPRTDSRILKLKLAQQCKRRNGPKQPDINGGKGTIAACMFSACPPSSWRFNRHSLFLCCRA